VHPLKRLTEIHYCIKAGPCLVKGPRIELPIEALGEQEAIVASGDKLGGNPVGLEACEVEQVAVLQPCAV